MGIAKLTMREAYESALREIEAKERQQQSYEYVVHQKELAMQQQMLTTPGQVIGVQMSPIIDSKFYDPNNISGAKLAEIGRSVMGMKTNIPKKYDAQLIDSAWLDERVEEICRKGRL
jgi:hypothetical protein